MRNTYTPACAQMPLDRDTQTPTHTQNHIGYFYRDQRIATSSHIGALVCMRGVHTHTHTHGILCMLPHSHGTVYPCLNTRALFSIKVLLPPRGNFGSLQAHFLVATEGWVCPSNIFGVLREDVGCPETCRAIPQSTYVSYPTEFWTWHELNLDSKSLSLINTVVSLI